MSEFRILVGDCLAVMPTLDADSVDAIVTDPPYGLAFLGTSWDHDVPGEPFWREAEYAALSEARYTEQRGLFVAR